MKSIYKPLIIYVLFLACSSVQAQILASWQFEDPIDSGTNPSTSPTSTSAGITAANATVAGVTNAAVTHPGSDGSGPNDTYYAFSASGWPAKPVSGTAALDVNKYFEYTISASPGCSFNPSGLIINHRTDDSPYLGPGYYEVRTSYDGFTTSLNRGVYGSVTEVDANFTSGTFSSSQNSSPPSPFGVAGQTSLTFRVYYYDFASEAAVVRMDRIRVGGRVTCPPPMPVSFAYFQGKTSGNRVNLRWETNWERNADQFVIERSQNATEFGAVGRVKASGESTEKQAYSFTDEQALTGVNYYRLRQIDRDGKVQYSQIIALTTSPDSPAIAILGNPAEAGRVQLELFNVGGSNLQLTDTQGRTVPFRVVESANGLVTLESPGLRSGGIYLIGAANVAAVRIVVR